MCTNSHSYIFSIEMHCIIYDTPGFKGKHFHDFFIASKARCIIYDTKLQMKNKGFKNFFSNYFLNIMKNRVENINFVKNNNNLKFIFN